MHYSNWNDLWTRNENASYTMRYLSLIQMNGKEVCHYLSFHCLQSENWIVLKITYKGTWLLTQTYVICSYIMIFTEVSCSIMPGIIWFVVYINNNKLGLNSPAHPAVDCQTIYFSDKRFPEFTAERNYILLADINWHLVSHGNKILSRNASRLKVQHLFYI